MDPRTRQQIDSMLGRMGYSLSYTEEDARTLVEGRALATGRTRQYPVSGGVPEAPPRTTGSAESRPHAKIVLWHMLQAFAEGLWVCARLSARLVLAAYRYAGQRFEELRDPDRADQNTRPTLRMRIDDGLEQALEALETRVRALSPMPTLRRVRAAFAAKRAEAYVRIDRIWWPEEEREQERESEDMDVSAPQEPGQVAELDPVRLTSPPEPVARLKTETGNVFDKATVEPLRPPSEPRPVTVQSHDVREGSDPPAAAQSSGDLAENVTEPVFAPDRDDRPWFLRWSSLFSFLRRRETRLPSVFDRSLDLDTASDDPVLEDAAPEEPEGLKPLEWLERMLDSNGDTPPTEDEIEALSRRRPREL